MFLRKVPFAVFAAVWAAHSAFCLADVPIPSAEDRAAEKLRKLGATIERDHDGQVCWVHLEKSRVTDDDLARLAPLKSLRVLNLCGTDVEGRGLEHLKGLTNLELVHLQDAVLTEEEKAMLPNVTIKIEYWD